MSKNKNGLVLWFTGLSAAGKTTIADAVYEKLKDNFNRIERLDGDVVRQNLSNLSFSKGDRDKNMKRVGFVANLLSRNGVNVVASFISPYKEQREMLKRSVVGFIEIHVHAPLAVCERRDPKGMYKKARAGEIKNFTGIDDPYEEPVLPDLRLETDKHSVEECVLQVLEHLKER